MKVLAVVVCGALILFLIGPARIVWVVQSLFGG